MVEALLPLFERQNVFVREIWSWDTPMGGETALVNSSGYLYNEFSNSGGLPRNSRRPAARPGHLVSDAALAHALITLAQ
jgi:hypothetical protein